MCDKCQNLEYEGYIIVNGTAKNAKGQSYAGSAVCMGKDRNNDYTITLDTWLGFADAISVNTKINYCPFCGRKFI